VHVVCAGTGTSRRGVGDTRPDSGVSGNVEYVRWVTENRRAEWALVIAAYFLVEFRAGLGRT
jgi:hypothetical protein